MPPESFEGWIAWAGIVIPLAALAWAAYRYIRLQERQIQHEEFKRVFEVMDRIGMVEGSIASKLAGTYELRKYPEYKDVIIRFCEGAQVQGDSETAKMFRNELNLTAEHLRKVRANGN